MCWWAPRFLLSFLLKKKEKKDVRLDCNCKREILCATTPTAGQDLRSFLGTAEGFRQGNRHTGKLISVGYDWKSHRIRFVPEQHSLNSRARAASKNRRNYQADANATDKTAGTNRMKERRFLGFKQTTSSTHQELQSATALITGAKRARAALTGDGSSVPAAAGERRGSWGNGGRRQGLL
jgi:hypothetical protein